MTDPIADLACRIRNGIMAGKDVIEVPFSRIKKDILEILKNGGYIEDFSVMDDRRQGILRIYLRYVAPKKNAIAGIKRESKPGKRIYVGKDQIPRVKGGLGLAILSTSKGILTDDEARKEGVGGELLLTVW